jgi:hypothetical protein
MATSCRLRRAPVEVGGNSSVAAADVNGDGHDVVVLSYSGPVVVPGRGDGGFSSAVEFPLPGGALFIAVADLNGDRALDLVATSNSPPAVTVLLACPR